MSQAAEVQPTWDKALLRGDKFIKQYCQPPHDIIRHMYNFSSGEIFFYLFTGLPGVASQHFGVYVRSKCERTHENCTIGLTRGNRSLLGWWWPRLEAQLPGVWRSFSKVIPLRIYGDGADAARKFEFFSLLPILACSSSTMDTRLVLSVRNCSRTYSDCRVKLAEVIAWSFEALRLYASIKFSLGCPRFFWPYGYQEVWVLVVSWYVWEPLDPFFEGKPKSWLSVVFYNYLFRVYLPSLWKIRYIRSLCYLESCFVEVLVLHEVHWRLADSKVIDGSWIARKSCYFLSLPFLVCRYL